MKQTQLQILERIAVALEESNRLNSLGFGLKTDASVPKNQYPVWKTLTMKGEVTKKQLEDAGINVGIYASNVLEKVTFKDETLDLVLVSVKELGFDDSATTEQIYARAKEKGLELCPASVGAHLRLQYNDQPLDDWFYIGMEPITARDGHPRVFALGRDGDGLWLRSRWADPAGRWFPDCRFVFRRK